MGNKLKVVGFILFLSLFPFLILIKKKKSTKNPEKEKGKEKKKKKESPSPQKEKVPPIPSYRPIDQSEAISVFRTMISRYQDYLKEKVLKLLSDLETLKRFDRQIRLDPPFTSAEVLKGIRDSRPSPEEEKALRKFWVTSSQVPLLLEEIGNLGDVKKEVDAVLNDLPFLPKKPTRFGFPYFVQFPYYMELIRKILESLSSETSQKLLQEILQRFIQKIDKEIQNLQD
ncbi:MAG: hypothetical protein D6785_14945, partial [Planctomycetota bacterium]